MPQILVRLCPLEESTLRWVDRYILFFAAVEVVEPLLPALLA